MSHQVCVSCCGRADSFSTHYGEWLCLPCEREDFERQFEYEARRQVIASMERDLAEARAEAASQDGAR